MRINRSAPINTQSGILMEKSHDQSQVIITPRTHPSHLHTAHSMKRRWLKLLVYTRPSLAQRLRRYRVRRPGWGRGTILPCSDVPLDPLKDPGRARAEPFRFLLPRPLLRVFTHDWSFTWIFGTHVHRDSGSVPAACEWATSAPRTLGLNLEYLSDLPLKHSEQLQS